MGVAAKICDLQNSGFVNDAKECVQERLFFCGVIEHGSQGIDLITRGYLGKAQSGGGRNAGPSLQSSPHKRGEAESCVASDVFFVEKKRLISFH